MTEDIHIPVIDLKPPNRGVAEYVLQDQTQNDCSPNYSNNNYSSPLSRGPMRTNLSVPLEYQDKDKMISNCNAVADSLEKGYLHGHGRRHRLRSKSINDEPKLSGQKSCRAHKKSYSVNCGNLHHPSLKLSREEMKQSLLGSTEVFPYHELKTKKTRSTRHIRSHGIGHCNLKQCSPKSASFARKSHMIRNSPSKDNNNCFSYGSLDLFGYPRNGYKSLKYHPGIGLDEFDPRKEFVYYASHYMSSSSANGYPCNVPRRHRSHSLSDSFSMSEYLTTSDEQNNNTHTGNVFSFDRFDISDHANPKILNDSDRMSVSADTSNSKGHRRHLSESRMQRIFKEQMAIERSKGENQPIAFRDIFAAIIFLIQIGIMFWSGIEYGPRAMAKLHFNKPSYDEINEDMNEVWMHYRFIIGFAAVCGLFASFLALIALSLLMSVTENVIKYSLVTSIGVAFAWGTIGVGYSPQSLIPLSGIISLVLFSGYSFMVWDRIPFATANLLTALKAVQANEGLLGITYGMLALTYCWCMWFIFIFIGLYDHLIETRGAIDSSSLIILTSLCISCYWIYQVLKVSEYNNLL